MHVMIISRFISYRSRYDKRADYHKCQDGDIITYPYTIVTQMSYTAVDMAGKTVSMVYVMITTAIQAISLNPVVATLIHYLGLKLKHNTCLNIFIFWFHYAFPYRIDPP